MPPIQALRSSSGDVIADRRFMLAQDLAARGDLAAAVDLLAQTLELVPQFASGWFALGTLRAATGDRDGAVAAFETVVGLDADDRQGAKLQLQRLGAGQLSGMPPAYVRTLFDQYAPGFDAALIGELSYRAPDLLRDAVMAACDASARSRHFGSMFDLGCGTGLAGVAFRKDVAHLTGVDLSPGMVALAQRRAIYDRLEPVDLMDFLSTEAAAAAPSADLIIASDVFAYFADLAPLVRTVAQRLAPGAVFAFTVETHDGEGVILAETLRYAHSASHVRDALAAADLAVASLQPAWPRTEKGVPVPGLVVVARPARP